MFENLGEHLAILSDDKGISKELLLEVVEETLRQALKKQYHDKTDFNIKFDGQYNPTIYRKVTVVENVEDPDIHISLDEAKEINEDIELDEEVWLIIDHLEAFGRIESTQAKSTFRQKLSELEKNLIYNEFKRREAQLVNGYYQREYKGTIYVNLGKTEGILLRRDQSPRENYTVGDRIRAYIYKVDNSRGGHPAIYLTRTKGDFLKKLFELEVPEISDGIVSIVNVVRRAGLKTKMAVESAKSDVDPVGACVGQKGVRIQSVIKEIEGEKIDVVKYSSDIREYISNAIAPAKCLKVIITDNEEKKALVVVPDDQLSLAIGKGGYNIRMAGELTGFSIDIKTEEDLKENPELLEEVSAGASGMFMSEEEAQGVEAAAIEEESIIVDEPEPSNLYSLEGISDEVIETLIENGIDSITALYSKSAEEIAEASGLDKEMCESIINILKESVQFVDEDEDEEGEAESLDDEYVDEYEVYECPNCGAEINETMDKCPACGIEISFE